MIEANDPVPTLAISRDLIDRRRGHVGVWKLERGRAVWIPVALGYPAGGSVQIVGGLDPGNVYSIPTAGTNSSRSVCARNQSTREALHGEYRVARYPSSSL